MIFPWYLVVVYRQQMQLLTVTQLHVLVPRSDYMILLQHVNL